MDSLVNFANGVKVETLTGTRTLVNSDPLILKLDPGGAHRDVTLDGSGTGSVRSGALRFLVNAADAAENLVVKDAAGNTVATINQNEAGLFASNSSTNAWTLVAIWAIALS